MPKMKTSRGAAKRFKRTGSGKLKRFKATKSHLLTGKPTRPRTATASPATSRSPTTRQ